LKSDFGACSFTLCSNIVVTPLHSKHFTNGIPLDPEWGMVETANARRETAVALFAMTMRLYVTLAATLCLLGCSKEEPTAAPKTDAGAPPATTATSAATTAPANAQTNDMIKTASGLKYQVLKKGSGDVAPKATDTVKVHYHGTLLNGTVFDSSVERGEPISFPLNRVIRGWTEGLQLMKVGDKFRFEIPPDLAYGPSSPTAKIPPNSTLVFEVELLGIQ